MATHDAVNPATHGTKAAAHYILVARRRRDASRCGCGFAGTESPHSGRSADFDAIFADRQREADEFYATVIPQRSRRRRAQRACARPSPACCGRSSSTTTWSATGSRAIRQPHRRRQRANGRNHEWTHLYNADVISMPDKWEYPWYAAWDLAFHCVPLALVDSEFAKEQLMLMTARVVHASERADAGLRMGVRRRQSAGARLGRVARLQDRQEAPRRWATARSSQRVFHKLLLNFTWWVNRKDAEGRTSSRADSSASTTSASSTAARRCPPAATSSSPTAPAGWRCTCLNLLAIAMELASEDPAYEDVASKFWEHFLYIAHAMNHRGRRSARACGTRRTASSTSAAHARWRPHAAEGPLHGRADSAVRGGDAGAGMLDKLRASSAAWSGSSRTART